MTLGLSLTLYDYTSGVCLLYGLLDDDDNKVLAKVDYYDLI